MDTVKTAAANFITYSVNEARIASAEMLKIMEQLKDRVISVHPLDIKYNIEDFSEIAKRSNHHNNRYPATLSDVIPISVNKNAQFLYQQVKQNSHPFIQELVDNHDAEFADLGSHVQAARKIMRTLSRKIKVNPVEDLEKKDIISLWDYQSIQERPETGDVIEKFNNIIFNRPDIIETVLKIQSQACHVLQAMIDENPQLRYEEIAYSEIGFLHDGLVVPNSRLLKVITNNYGPYFYKYADESAENILAKSSLDAENDGMFSQNLFLFKENGDSYSLMGMDNRACPAIRSIGPIVRHLTSLDIK